MVTKRKTGWMLLSGLSLAGGAALLSALAAGGPPQEPAPPGPAQSATLRVEVDVVNLYCTVKDKKGRLITDLSVENFEVKEDGKKQEVRYFTRETDRPLTLALLLDTSGSQKGLLPVEKEAASQFFQQVMRPGDLALLITFDVNVDLMQDFTEEVKRLLGAIERARINAPGNPINPGPFPRRQLGTRLYDAVYLVSKEKMASEVGRKVVILISDGQDIGSMVDKKKAIEMAHRSEVIIYTIGIADPEIYYGRPGGPYIGRGELKDLAKETGGRAIFPSKMEELQEAFDQIADELRSQYNLGYSPTKKTRDGRFRKIQVKVKGRKGLKVQARRGYYAPKE